VLNADVVTTSHDTYVSRFSPGTGWGAAVKLGKLNKPAYVQKHKPGHHLNPQYDYGRFLFDSQGKATLIWSTYFDEVPVALHARRFDGADELSVMATQTLYNDPEFSPQSIVDLDGFTDSQGMTHVFRLMKAWAPTVEGPDIDAIILQRNSFDPIQGWRADARVVVGRLGEGMTVTSRGVTLVNVAGSDDFAVFVSVWVDDLTASESSTGVYLNRFVKGAWSGMEEVVKNPFMGTLDPIVAVNGLGETMIMWAKLDTTAPNNSMMSIMARTFSTVDGLGPVQTVAQRVSTLVSFDTVSGFSAVINSNGVVAVTWTEYEKNSYASQSYAVLYEPIAGWGEVTSIITQLDVNPLVSMPQLAINDNNTIGVVWITGVNNSTGNNSKTIMYKEHSLPAVAGVSVPVTVTVTMRDVAVALPLPTEAWTASEVVWQLPRQQLMHKLASPQLLMNGDGELFLSVFATITDRSTALPMLGYTAEFLSFDVTNNAWISQSEFISPPQPTLPPSFFLPPPPAPEPLPPAPPPPFSRSTSVTDYVAIMPAIAAELIYSAWVEGGELFVSTLQWPDKWSAAQSIVAGVEAFYLVDDGKGGALLVWQETVDLLTLKVSRLTVLLSGQLEIQVPVMTRVLEGQFADQPVVNMTGELAVLWLATTPEPVLQMILFTANGGWEVPLASQVLTGMDLSLSLLGATADGHWVVVSQRLPERQLVATRFTPQQAWDEWVSADGNTGKIDAIMGLPRLANNRNGDLMLLWIEETRDTQGVLHQIYTSEYSSTATGQVWSSPALVSSTEHLTEHQMPTLFLSDDGRALVVWASHTPRRNTGETLAGYPALLSLVLVNKYIPETGWLAQPETVFVQKESFLPAIAPRVLLLPNDKIVVIWKGILLDPYGNVLNRDLFGVVSVTSQF